MYPFEAEYILQMLVDTKLQLLAYLLMRFVFPSAWEPLLDCSDPQQCSFQDGNIQQDLMIVLLCFQYTSDGKCVCNHHGQIIHTSTTVVDSQSSREGLDHSSSQPPLSLPSDLLFSTDTITKLLPSKMLEWRTGHRETQSDSAGKQ